MLLRSGVPARRRNATALDGNATHELACRKTGNSSVAGTRDVLWTNAGFSAAFWAANLERYSFRPKTLHTALTGVIGSHHASREPYDFSKQLSETGQFQRFGRPAWANCIPIADRATTCAKFTRLCFTTDLWIRPCEKTREEAARGRKKQNLCNTQE